MAKAPTITKSIPKIPKEQFDRMLDNMLAAPPVKQDGGKSFPKPKH